MSGNPLDRIPGFDRVSVRAVVVMEGEDPGPLLAAAGIVDPVAVPVVFGADAPDRRFGDGLTPNVSAVVEFDERPEDEGDEPSDVDESAGSRPARSPSAATEVQPFKSDTSTLPAAYGMTPLAPVRRSGS
jgi:hypothetical protein